MKVLFLDIDGVLNNHSLRYSPDALSKPSCDALNSILNIVPELKMVISSAWRMHGLDFMQKLLEKNGIDGDKVIDCTGNEDGDRGHQIQCWLDRNPEVTNIVILDDNSDMGNLLNKLIKTNSFVGLTSKDADDAVKMLKKPLK